MAADDFQWIFDPANWSEKKLFGKFHSFAEHKDNVIRIVNKSLMNEEIGVTKEVLKRTSNITEIYIEKCFLGDGSFKVLGEGILAQHKLRVLSLQNNNLSSDAVQFIIQHFSKTKFTLSFTHVGQSARLEVLDLRGNHLTESDASMLYDTFSYCSLLNGIPISALRADTTMTSLSLKSLQLHHAEMVIVSRLLTDVPSIEELELSGNLFDVTSLKYLVNLLKSKPAVHHLDLSHNGLLRGIKGDDESGLEALALFMQRYKHLTRLQLEGINLPTHLRTLLARSLQVNRSVQGSLQLNFFESHIAKVAARSTPPARENLLKDWTPNLDVDAGFCRLNGVEACVMQYTDKSITFLKR